MYLWPPLKFCLCVVAWYPLLPLLLIDLFVSVSSGDLKQQRNVLVQRFLHASYLKNVTQMIWWTGANAVLEPIAQNIPNIDIADTLYFYSEEIQFFSRESVIAHAYIGSLFKLEFPFLNHIYFYVIVCELWKLSFLPFRVKGKAFN